MKKRLFAIIAGALLTLNASQIYAQNRTEVIKDKELKISTKLKITPKYTVQNVDTKGTNPKQWLQIDVEYYTRDIPDRANPLNNSKKWLDGAYLKYEVVMKINYNGKGVYTLMTGKVTYWAIHLDGKKHYAMAHIQPQVLERYKSTKRYKTAIEDSAVVKVTMYSSSNVEIASGYSYPRKSNEAKAKSLIEGARKSLNVLKQEGIVLGRNDTPWKFVDIDRYDLIKKDGTK